MGFSVAVPCAQLIGRDRRDVCMRGRGARDAGASVQVHDGKNIKTGEPVAIKVVFKERPGLKKSNLQVRSWHSADCIQHGRYALTKLSQVSWLPLMSPRC